MVRDTAPGEKAPHVPDVLSMQELLRVAIDNGIIDMAHVADAVKDMKTKEVLKAHENNIWQGKNGYFYTHLPDENRTLVKKKNLDDLYKVIVIRVQEDEKAKADAPTVADIFKRWNDLRLKKEFIQPSTHAVDDELFNRCLSDFAKMKIKDVKKFWLVEYLEGLVSEQGLTAKAFSNIKGLVKGVLEEARREDLIDYTVDDVFRELKIPKRAFKRTVKDDAEETFTSDEIQLIVTYILSEPTIRNLAILLMFISGIRIGELVSLKWDDIHEGYFVVDETETRKKSADGKWEFYVRESPKTKAGERLVAIPEGYTWIWEAIRQATQVPGEYLFVNEQGERLTANCIRSRFRKVCNRVGIPPRSPHKIRKTYCSILFESHRLDSIQISRLMGHAEIETSERYYLRDRTDIDDKIRAVSQITEFMIEESNYNKKK